MRRLIFPVVVIAIATLIFFWTRGPEERQIDTSIVIPEGALPSKPIPRLEPGTRVGDGPANGWSHLVLKSRPKVNSGDVDKVLGPILEGIGKFSTSVLVRTEPDPKQAGRFRIAAFAAGLGSVVEGQDVILTAATAKNVGVPLDMMQGLVLEEREKEFKDVLCPVTLPTMAIVDFPAHVARGAEHVKVVMRYAALVDPQDGRIETLLWVLDLTGSAGYAFSGDSFFRLEPNQTMDWELHVDATKFNFMGQPKPDAFATTTRPRGVPIPAPEQLKGAAAATRFTANSAAALEQKLRELLTGGKS